MVESNAAGFRRYCAPTEPTRWYMFTIHLTLRFLSMATVSSYTRIRNGIIEEVQSHTRSTSSGWQQHKRDVTAPKRTPEQMIALRAKFAKHRLPRS